MSAAVFPAMALRVAVFAAIDVEGRVHLGHLPLAQLSQGGGQQGGDLGAQAGGDLRRPGQEEVAGHDGHQVAEPGVDALHIATHGRLVHHVVVVEGCQVDQLDGHGSEQVLAGGRAGTGGGGGQGQDRSQALPSGGQAGGWSPRRGIRLRSLRSRRAGARGAVAVLRVQEAQGALRRSLPTDDRPVCRLARKQIRNLLGRAGAGCTGACRLCGSSDRGWRRWSVRTIHRPGSTSSSARSGRGASPQPQLHRH